jgi:hypothetical protein
MRPIQVLALMALVPAYPLLAAPPGTGEREVWSLEDAYWRYVQTDDLEHYRTLWNKDFLGWPLSSPEPVRKDHITDWITLHTSVGDKLKSYSLERLASQATADYVTVTYRVRLTWSDKGGADKASGLRVIHTWRQSSGQWQIISGMAAAPNADGH